MLLDNFLSEDKKVVNGKDIKFTVKCDKCGADANITPRRFFQYNHNVHPTKITLEIKCTYCKNQFTGIIL